MYNTGLLQQSYILSSAFASIGASNSIYKKRPDTASKNISVGLTRLTSKDCHYLYSNTDKQQLTIV